ncbi:MAG: TetR/AcrR family transcriptional regulator C-terminal domain-containing protein, partial [Actinomycetia bacterium]|nr:TetR/AcrR family transcriptional regulator C-terminal domain-containing protein [Actinomycetes bacterium]
MGEGSIWLRPVRAAKGPVPEYSRAQIARAAIAVADSDGLATVTMRRVATEVGGASASLYRYVATRDELLDLMIDEVSGEFENVERSGSWLDDLLRLANEFRTIYLRHTWLVGAIGPTTPIGPNAVRFLENALTLLQDVTVEPAAKLEAIAVFSGVIRMLVGFELDRSASRETVTQWQAGQAAYLAYVAGNGEHPHLAAAIAAAGEPADSAPVFDRVLERVL